MKMPRILRHDALLFQLGTAYKQIRKDRDGWELVGRPGDEEPSLYYLDIRPDKMFGRSIER